MARAVFIIWSARESERTACSFLEKRVARIPALKRPCGTRGSPRISANASTMILSSKISNFHATESKKKFLRVSDDFEDSNLFHFSPLILMYKIVIEIYNLEWKERKLATRSRSKKRASCIFKLSTNWTNVHEYPGNEWRNSIPPWNWVLLVRPLISTGAKMAGVPRVLAPWCISSNADRNRPRYDFAVYSSGISPWNLWRVLHWREKLARFIGARDTEGRIIDRNTVFIRSRDDDGGFRSDECQLCWPVETRYSLLPFMDGVGMLSPRSFNNTDNIESILHGGHNAIRMWVTRTTFLEEFSFATAIFLLLLSFSCKSLLKYCFGRAYKMIDIETLQLYNYTL